MTPLENKTARSTLASAIATKDGELIRQQVAALGTRLSHQGGTFVSLAMGLPLSLLREVLPLLLKAGAPVQGNPAWRDGQTPLHQAVLAHHPTDILDTLNAYGAVLDARPHEGRGDPPFLVAAREHNAPALRWLLAQGANPDERDLEGKTALGLIAENARLFRVEGLDAECGSPERSTLRAMFQVFLDQGTSLRFIRDVVRAQAPGSSRLTIESELEAWEASRSAQGLDATLPASRTGETRPRF